MVWHAGSLIVAKGEETPPWPPFEGFHSMTVGVLVVLAFAGAIVLIRRPFGVE
jgi:hypothetical protein